MSPECSQTFLSSKEQIRYREKQHKQTIGLSNYDLSRHLNGHWTRISGLENKTRNKLIVDCPLDLKLNLSTMYEASEMCNSNW